jgi:hypothetical protein
VASWFEKILNLFRKPKQQAPVQEVPAPKEPAVTRTWKDVDWSDKGDKVSRYFTVWETIGAPQWNRLQDEGDGLDDGAKEALFGFMNDVMDEVREHLGAAVIVHITYRCPEYNKLIGGAGKSAHMARSDAQYGLIAACDFHADIGQGSTGANCDKVREILLPLLDSWDIRMENNGEGSTWVHLDNRAPGPSGRYFPPK